jgi:hypothetical protein
VLRAVVARVRGAELLFWLLQIRAALSKERCALRGSRVDHSFIRDSDTRAASAHCSQQPFRREDKRRESSGSAMNVAKSLHACSQRGARDESFQSSHACIGCERGYCCRCHHCIQLERAAISFATAPQCAQAGRSAPCESSRWRFVPTLPPSHREANNSSQSCQAYSQTEAKRC